RPGAPILARRRRRVPRGRDRSPGRVRARSDRARSARCLAARVAPVASDRVRELLRREPAGEEYAAIRELWKRHSIAEDNRDLPGLLSTLTEDCVYELVQTGRRWEGHEGAARFYGGLLGAFPDVDFQLTDIVIGP